MKADSFDWKKGRITFWDLDLLDREKHVSEQLDLLKEDLAQIEFPNGTVLDLGWYPSFHNQGMFKIVLVKDRDWEAPLFEEYHDEIPRMICAVEAAIQLASDRE